MEGVDLIWYPPGHFSWHRAIARSFFPIIGADSEDLGAVDAAMMEKARENFCSEIPVGIERRRTQLGKNMIDFR